MYTLKLLNLVVVASVVNSVYGYKRGDFEKYGPFNLILNSGSLKCYHGRTIDLDVQDITVYFYDFTTGYSDSFPIENAAESILSIKNLDKSRKFIIYVGGFMSKIDGENEDKIRRAYATYSDSYLIIPDHSPYTNNKRGMVAGYQRAVTNVHFIGKAIGKMWAKLYEGGISPKNVHCVGFSLGGQIISHIGEIFFKLTGEKISRITALDPAGPCFSNSKNSPVRSEVADYVEVFHCNSGALGDSRFLGTIDYIVNDGKKQLSCNTPYVPDLLYSTDAAICSHTVCLHLWAATVKNERLFKAYSYICDSNRKFKRRKCIADETIAGASGPATAKGIYYIKVTGYDLSETWW